MSSAEGWSVDDGGGSGCFIRRMLDTLLLVVVSLESMPSLLINLLTPPPLPSLRKNNSENEENHAKFIYNLNNQKIHHPNVH